MELEYLPMQSNTYLSKSASESSQEYADRGPSEEEREKYHNLSGLPFDCGCCTTTHNPVWER